MSRKEAAFTYRDKFSSYMAVVLDNLAADGRGCHCLDIPAGAGRLG